MFAKHFVSAHQQVGDFRVVKIGGRVQKNGGNVASHFLTPSGHVVHSVTGPVSARVLIDEAQWAIDTYTEAKAKTEHQRLKHIARAHGAASLTPISGQDRQVHELLMNRPLPHLQTVYQHIFEKILGQRVSKAGPRLAQASRSLEFAKKSGRPILFVLHDGNTWVRPMFSSVTRQLIDEFVVVVMPIRETPALSQLTGQPPFEVDGGARPQLVVARSDCLQLHSVSGWREERVIAALAAGWADAMERNPPSVRTLVRAQRLLRKAHPETADQVRELTIRVQKEAREAREAANKLAAR